MENTGKYCLIRHIVLCTGLSDRTIRNYIASGLLQGEKIHGLWHFTREQVEAFIRHPTVRPSILARNHADVYDFLLDDKKTACGACIVLDLPGEDRKETAEFFCRHISHGDFHRIRFSFDGVGSVPRVILTGDMEEVLRLIRLYQDFRQS